MLSKKTDNGINPHVFKKTWGQTNVNPTIGATKYSSSFEMKHSGTYIDLNIDISSELAKVKVVVTLF